MSNTQRILQALLGRQEDERQARIRAWVAKREEAARSHRPGSTEAHQLEQLFELAGDEPGHPLDNRKPVRAYLRKLSPDQRAGLFRHIYALRLARNWGDTPFRRFSDFWSNTSGPARLREPADVTTDFEVYCEFFLQELCEVGFAVDQPLAELVLNLLAEERLLYRLRDRLLSKDKGRVLHVGGYALGVMRDIRRAQENGMPLSAPGAGDARRIFDLYHTDSRRGGLDLRCEHTRLGKIGGVLLAIAGEESEPGFFELMRHHLDNRAVAWKPKPDLRLKLKFFETVLDEAASLLAAIESHYAGADTCRTWLKDKQLFEQTFDPPEEDQSGSFVFGWWLDPEPEGIFTNPEFQHVREPRWKLMTREELEEACRQIFEGENNGPFVFTGEGVPDIEAFTFGRRDPDGEFLNHLAGADASRPPKPWIAKTSRHVARIGGAHVLAGFRRWLGHLDDMDLSVIERRRYSKAQTLQFILANGHDKPLGNSRPFTEEMTQDRLLARQVALKMLHRHPHCLRSLANFEVRDTGMHFERRRMTGPLSEVNTKVMCGVIWALAQFDDTDTIALLEELGRKMFTRCRSELRSRKCGNAVLWSLGQIGTPAAVYALARIRRAVRDKSVAKLVDKALTAAGEKIGLALADMQELSMADYGIGPDGERVEMFGDIRVTLKIVSSRKAMLTSLDTADPKAKEKRGIAKAALGVEGARGLADELKQAAKDIDLLLPEARNRLEMSWRHGRVWACADWQERFIDNGLVATLARRLIWRFTRPDGSFADALPLGEEFLGTDGKPLTLDPGETCVTLWHPLIAPEHEVAAWRRLLRERGIHQPFMQAWRPVYTLTDAERQTETYSNRFAGHILHQPPLVAMLRKRGWTAASRIQADERSDRKRNEIALPAFGLSAQYWIAGIGDRVQEHDDWHGDYGAANFEYVTTDRLAFFRLDPKSCKPTDTPLPVTEIPPMALTEIMRDIDLVAGITSIGNDRFWADRGPGAAHPLSELPGAVQYRGEFAKYGSGELVKIRHAFLDSILPALRIADQCTLQESHLIVGGRLRTYRIHLGSGNILMAPNDRYLCIVKQAGNTAAEQVYVPFEGDETLALILSKAFMLARDDEIDDAAILHQIRTT